MLTCEVRRHENLVLATLFAGERAPTEAREAVQLTVVLDTSGSMAGEKLQLCKKSLAFVIEQALEPSDSLALVTFASEAFVRIPLALLNKAGAMAKINALDACGSTAMIEGIEVGIAQKARSIILLTDGNMNEGKKNIMDVCAHVGKVHCFAYGTDADVDLLGKIADKTDGTFSWIKNPEDVIGAFAQVVAGETTVIARDIRIGTFGATNVQLSDMPIDVDRSIICKDMYEGERRDVLFSIIPEHTKWPWYVNIVVGNEVIPSVFIPDGKDVVLLQEARILSSKALAKATALIDVGKISEAQALLLDRLLANMPFNEPLKELNEDIKATMHSMIEAHEWKTSGKAQTIEATQTHKKQRSGKAGASGNYKTSKVAKLMREAEGEA